LNNSSWSRRIVTGVAVLLLLAIAAVGALLTALWLERRTDVTLTAPTGPFVVGRASYAWTDDHQVDPLAPVPGTRRELLAWIWYPSASGPSTPIDDYVPARIRAAIGPPAGPMSLVTRDFSKVHGHSAHDSAVAPWSFPVVIIRAGASAGVVGYSALAEDLASHGYVVVGFDAPYRTNIVVFPDGRVMRRLPENNPEVCVERPRAQQDGCMATLLAAWTSDIAFTLDRLEQLNASDASGRLTGRLDVTRVGVFGHSLGGASAAQFCHDDTRCKAGINIDGQPFGSVVQEGMQQPFMMLLSDHGSASDPVSRQIEANLQSLYDHLPAHGRHRLTIRGANHFLFSDDGAFLKSRLLLRALRLFGVVGIDGPRQIDVTRYVVRTFFDAYLKQPGGMQPGPSPLYPEVQVVE